MTPQEFIAKWKRRNLSERSAAQQHFLDLCDLLGQPKVSQLHPYFINSRSLFLMPLQS